jgi:hypothetical protein
MDFPTRSLLAAAAVCLVFPAAAAAQAAKPVCDLVTEKEAAAVIGSVQQKQSILGEDHCTFTTKDFSLTIQRLRGQKPETLQMMLALPKNRARPGDVVTDEAGIGQGAVSERSKGRLNIFVVSGGTLWTFGVEHVYNKDLTEMLPELRELARKLAGGVSPV